jgi:FixJ family two-component response regulator
MKMQSFNGATVFVIDGDAWLRAALKKLFESVGLNVELFASGNKALERAIPDMAGCIVLDVRLQGLSGLKLQEELAKANIQLPLVFLTEHGDIPMAVRAIKAGAVDFLTKPFREQDLLDAVTTALERDRARRADALRNATLLERFGSLSAREQDVVARVAAGALNKQIASDLGISEVTVKVHRANAMRKLRTKSVAELVRMTEALRSIDMLGRTAGELSCGTRRASTTPASSTSPTSRPFLISTERVSANGMDRPCSCPQIRAQLSPRSTGPTTTAKRCVCRPC